MSSDGVSFLLDEAHVPELLAGLEVVPSRDMNRPSTTAYLWLSVTPDVYDRICAKAGLDRNILLQQGVLPSIHLPLTPALKSVVESFPLYEADGSNYYLVMHGASGALSLKYQSIIGTRHLTPPEPSVHEDLVSAVAAKMLQNKDFTHPVERFRETATGGLIVRNGKRISALRSQPVVTAPSIGKSRDASEAKRPLEASLLADLEKLTVDPSNVQHLRLPADHLPNYAGVKALLMKAGGRYNSKGYFAFPEGIDVAAVHRGLMAGQVVNGKKDQQFFATPEEKGQEVVAAAGPAEGRRWLEPSAGDGALADIARAKGADVTVIENWSVNVAKLRAKGYDVIDRDFLTVTPDEIGTFDAIIANPPFSKNQDIDHVMHMVKFLEPGGVLSAIVSQGWRRGGQAKHREFAAFLEEMGAEIVDIEAGAFAESGTGVPTCRISFTKPPELVLEAKMDTRPRQASLGF